MPKCDTHAIFPPYRSTKHSKPMHTPRIGTFPWKYSIAGFEIPESVFGCPGPGEMIRYLIFSFGNKEGEMASFRMTVTSAPFKQSCW